MKCFKCSAIVVSVLFIFAIIGSIRWNSLDHSRHSSSNVAAVSDQGLTSNGRQTLPDKQKLNEQYGKLPINFEPNVGQADESVRFLARGRGYSLLLKSDETLLSLRKPSSNKKQSTTSALRMKIVSANPDAVITGIGPTEGKTNYLTGNDPAKWQTDVPNYSKVKAAGVLPGIDLVYYGNGQRLEYDFVVAPGSDPKIIKMEFDGAGSASIDKMSGDLILETGAGAVRQLRPVAYQMSENGRTEITASYNLERENDKYQVSFQLGEYDPSRELVIDPILAYGTYLGGSIFDEARAIAVDAQGNAYVVGTSASLNFPVTPGTIKTTNPPSANNVQWNDAIVTKMNPSGTALVFSTYYGGRNGSESGGGVVVDSDGYVLISGTTMSNDLPVVNAYQSTFGGTDDAFAAKLNPTGSAILYSTYLGGNNTDLGGRIALNRTTGDAVYTGFASSGNFPTTPGVIKEKLCNDTPGSCNGIFYSGSYVVKLSANGNIIYSTLFDAGINDVSLDAADNAVVGGTAFASFPSTAGAYQTVSSGGIEGVVAKINPTGSAIVFGTFLGGGLQSDRVKGLVLDTDGNIYVAGQTENTAFPTTDGAFDRTFNGLEDGFVTKFNPSGSALVYSTFLGGTGRDQPFAIDLAPNNDAFVAGETTGPLSFPLRNSINGTNGTMFLTRLNTDASALVFSSLLGQGGAYDVAADASGNAYVTGQTTSIPVTPGAFQTMKGDPTSTSSHKDAYILKIAPADENLTAYSISGTVTDPTQFGNYQPITVTLSGTVSRSYILPYGSGSGVIPYYFGNLPAGGSYTVSADKIGFTTLPENVAFTNLGANQFADFTIQPNQQPEGVITSPAHGTTFNAPATINIQAAASDPDGDPIAKVDFVAYSSSSGVINLGTDTTAPYEFTWSGVPVGTWSLSAIPTDSKGLRGFSTPVVHVFVVDPNPVSVSITSPIDGQTFSEGSYVPVSVNVSSSVNLVQVRDQNNNLVAWLTGSPWSVTWRVMAIGSYTLTATASNSQGQTATSVPVNITVGPINHTITGTIYDNVNLLPLAGVAINFVSPSNPSISANTVTDSTGRFVFTGLGTTPNDSAMITPTLAGYDFSPQNRSMAYLGYIDWPNQNFWGTRQTGITVNLTSPTDGQVFVAPATVNMTADASVTTGSIAKVEFYRRDASGSHLLSSDTTAPYSFEWVNVPVGTYFLFAKAFAANNDVAISDEARITVNAQPAGIRLQGDITNPGGGWMQGITVRLTGTVNGNPVNQTSISNSFGAYGFFNLVPGGNYTITPEGAGGMTFTPPSVTINNATADQFDIDFVTSAANQGPSVQINSPTDGQVFTMPVAIPMNATATDPDGQIVHLSVSAVSSTQSYTIGQSLNGTFSAPWQPTVPGQYTIWASARDNGGLQASVSLQITVNAPSPVSISGRIVDRGSVGIEGVTMELRDYPAEETVIGMAVTGADGRYILPGIATFSSYVLRASNQDYTFSPVKRIYFNLSASQTAADFTGTLQLQPSDFDGDGGSDLAVWRPSTGVWHVTRSTDNGYSASQFGGAAFGDKVVPGNYDGDRKIDYAVYRSGVWFILDSSTGTVRGISFGLPDDIPVPGDYDGDGKSDVAVFRPSDGNWYILRSSDGAYDFRHFGQNEDVPLVGDFDGDGIADLAVWRPAGGVWFVLQSTDGNMAAIQFGQSGDIPLIGDFDGDKRSDYTIYRPSNGVWYILQSSDFGFRYMQWGNETDKPVPGDYDRDGKTDFAVFRASEGNWYVYRSSTSSYSAIHFGAAGDVPIPGAFVR